MTDTRTIVLCAEHDGPPVTDDFISSLLSLWESIYDAPTGLTISLNRDSGWIYQFAIFLAKYFGYRTGTISYFRDRARVQDILVTPPDFGREISQVLNEHQQGLLRRVFAQGRSGESRRQPGERQGLAFPRTSEFEKRQGCALIPDGELSYFSLFYLWQQARAKHKQQSESFLRGFVKEWVLVLGILSDVQSPTVRLIRMLIWMQEYCSNDLHKKKAIQQYTALLLDELRTCGHIVELSDTATNKILLSHSTLPLSQESLLDLLNLLIDVLDSDFEKGEEVGENMPGLIALRCIKRPDKHYDLQSIDNICEYVSCLDPKYLDQHCTDRSDIIVPISISQLKEELYPIYYFGNHLGVSPQICAISGGVESATKDYHHLRLCLSALCGTMLASQIAKIEGELQEQKLEKEIADSVAHDLAGDIYEALAAGERPISHDDTFPDDHPAVQQLLVSADVQRQTLLGMFAAPWLQRERQKGKVRVDWSNRVPELADVQFWQKAIAYHSAAIIYGLVNPVINRLHRAGREESQCEERLRNIYISYIFTSNLTSALPSEQTIYPDPPVFYELMKEFETYRRQIPWPLSVDNVGSVIKYQGQKAIILAPVKESLRNAVKYVVDCVCANISIDQSAFCIGLSVELDSDARMLRFRINNATHPRLAAVKGLPPSLTRLQTLMGNYWDIKFIADHSHVVIEASFTCGQFTQ